MHTQSYEKRIPIVVKILSVSSSSSSLSSSVPVEFPVNTYYAGISCGYGIFPPKYIQNSIENSSIEDRGINEYNTTGSTIRKYFK